MTANAYRLRGCAPRKPQGPKPFEAGRICVQPDCDTKLSAYNPHDLCYRHAPLRYPHPRGRAAA